MNSEIESTLIKDLIKEKRADRRWRNIRSFIWILIVAFYTLLIFTNANTDIKTPKGPYVALVRLTGPILSSTSFSARKVLPELKKAFSDKSAQGVVLVIDSPGGSAVQASIIHDRILELKKRFHKKVVVVGEDALASGAYLVATAADKIFVNPDTLTGSIGVIYSGFGFVDAMNKLGISRRVYTAGDHKDRLDPFENLTPEDTAKMKTLLEEVHQSFIQDVVNGRGNRLQGNRDELFSGDFWTGQTAVKLGLVDGTANLWNVVRNEFNVRYVKDYSPHLTVFSTLLKDIGTELNVGLTSATTPLKEQAY